ncbi:hypothetical protein GCM10029963_60000 [Micromonospora andamanensis]
MPCRILGVPGDQTCLALLGSAGLDRTDGAEGTLQGPAETPHRLLRRLLGPPDRRQQQTHQHRHDDYRDQRGTQQHQVERAHQHERPDKRHRAVDQADEAAGRLVQQTRVGGRPGDQLTAGPTGQLVDPGGEVAADDPGPRVEHHPLGDAAHQHPLPERDGSADDDEGEQHGHRLEQRATGAQGVQYPLGHQRRGQPGGVGHQAEQQPEQHGRPVRSQVGQQEAGSAPGRLRVDRFGNGGLGHPAMEHFCSRVGK